VRGDDLLAEALERKRPRGGNEPVETLTERLEKPFVARRRGGRSSAGSSTRCRRRSTSATRGCCAHSGSASAG
jgi:hypothetical protein